MRGALLALACWGSMLGRYAGRYTRMPPVLQLAFLGLPVAEVFIGHQ